MNQRQLNAAAFTAAGVGAVVAARALARRWRAYDLRGKTVLITGGTRGLGLVLAREFAREGARLVICSRDAEEVERAREDLAGRGAEVLGLTCDVTLQEQVAQLFQAAEQRFGSVDVVVNNAGRIQVGPVEVMTL